MNELIKKYRLEIKSLFWGEPQLMATEEKMEAVVYFTALAALSWDSQKDNQIRKQKTLKKG